MTPHWDKAVADWVAARVMNCGPFDHDMCQAMGVAHQDKLVAGFVFHNYDPTNGLIEVSGVTEHPRWATKTVVRTALDYAFVTVGCQMIWMRQHIQNEAARRGWLHLGADEVIVPRLMGRGTVGTILTLTDDQWFASRIGRRSSDDGRRKSTGSGPATTSGTPSTPKAG